MVTLGLQPAEHASDAEELRASAAPRLRPADCCAIEFANKPSFIKNKAALNASFHRPEAAQLQPLLRPKDAAGRSFAPRRPAIRVPQGRSCVPFASCCPQPAEQMCFLFELAPI